MARRELVFPKGVMEVVEATRSGGTVLATGSAEGRNAMTIGWISAGSIWGRPCCVVLVRESRHTFKFMESGDSFTVNVLGEGQKDAVDLMGAESGRDMDKFAAAGVTPVKGLKVDSPYLEEAEMVIECRTALKQPMDPALISADYVKGCYPAGDYHTVYFGEIVGIHAK